MTKQMFNCQEKPQWVDPTKVPDSVLMGFITALELSRDNCADQLDTVENHLEINGVIVTDTLVTETKEKPRKRLGLF